MKDFCTYVNIELVHFPFLFYSHARFMRNLAQEICVLLSILYSHHSYLKENQRQNKGRVVEITLSLYSVAVILCLKKWWGFNYICETMNIDKSDIA